MTFLASLIQYVVKLVIFVLIAIVGVMAGKKMRMNKDAKETAKDTLKE
ncbi:MAG: hypothetical protein HFI37_00810 [Lachnospiraceae bacterium]|nr:hypothetical protein [Lachnospiraceae bacterium]